jgi:hypothetical protein
MCHRFESCTPHQPKQGCGGNALVVADIDMVRYAPLDDVSRR